MWGSDYCCMSDEQFFKLYDTCISWREQIIFWWDDGVCFVLDQHTDVGFLSFWCFSSLTFLTSVKIGQHLKSVTILECGVTWVQLSMTSFSLQTTFRNRYSKYFHFDQDSNEIYTDNLPVYPFPRSGIWAIQPLGPFLIICFHLPVGRYLVKIL
jgi:hypothetical protein